MTQESLYFNDTEFSKKIIARRLQDLVDRMWTDIEDTSPDLEDVLDDEFIEFDYNVMGLTIRFGFYYCGDDGIILIYDNDEINTTADKYLVDNLLNKAGRIMKEIEVMYDDCIEGRRIDLEEYASCPSYEDEHRLTAFDLV